MAHDLLSHFLYVLLPLRLTPPFFPVLSVWLSRLTSLLASWLFIKPMRAYLFTAHKRIIPQHWSLYLTLPLSFLPTCSFLSPSGGQLNFTKCSRLWCSTSWLRSNRTRWPTLKLLKAWAKVKLSSLKSTTSGVWSQQQQVTDREGEKEASPVSHGWG